MTTDMVAAEVAPNTRVLAEVLPSADVGVSVNDITMVLCVRLHEGNPWVADRIELMADYYDPRPKMLVVDFGSDEEYATHLQSIGRSKGIDVIRVEDDGIFSPSIARNRGFERVSTDLVFFCDVDCFGERDLFSRLASMARSLNMREVVDASIILPVYHMTEGDTEDVMAAHSRGRMSEHLTSFAFYASSANFKRETEFFIAPYSNVFLMNKNMFNISGGYDERFRGHGSDDFEYLVRLAIHSGHAPLPNDLTRDRYGPLKPDFFGVKDYRGFRRLFEVLAQPAESAGLKVFHLWHPRAQAQDWYASNDWKRERLNDSFNQYLSNNSNLISIDFINRAKTYACICTNQNEWGYFTPLRSLGIGLFGVYDSDSKTLETVSSKLAAGELSGIAIFNPYMKSHSKFKGLFVLAKDLGLDVVVIERGALPGSIYYANDVSYISHEYSEDNYNQSIFDDDEISSAERYIDQIRLGDRALEKSSSYEDTRARLSYLGHLTKTVCFIPLQLSQDMAVTMFVGDRQSYQDFVSSLDATIKANPDVLFVVKPHPLSVGDVSADHENCIIADRNDNIHALIDCANVVVCYNSGVGLLSILHEKPTITIGNAFYNVDGVGARAVDLAQAVSMVNEGRLFAPKRKDVVRLAAWFLSRKYSKFVARDHIREFSDRKAHGYKDILVTELRLGGEVVPLRRMREFSEFGWKSYTAFRCGLTITKSKPRVEPTPERLEAWGRENYTAGNYSSAASLFDRAYKLRPERHSLLRRAAEAHFSAGDVKTAVQRLDMAQKVMPKNRRVARRRAVMTNPTLRFMFGASRFQV